MKLKTVLKVLETLLEEDWTDPNVDPQKYKTEVQNTVQMIYEDNFNFGPDLNQEEKNLLGREGSKVQNQVQAVKAYRARTNQSLRVAWLKMQEYKNQ